LLLDPPGRYSPGKSPSSIDGERNVAHLFRGEALRGFFDSSR
jgi:hypothetical protein